MAWSTSDPVYVWCWLPRASEPVPAGVLTEDTGVLAFRYGRRYLERPDAMALGPELPLTADTVVPRAPLAVAQCLRDASPDAWGRQVIDFKRSGALASREDIGLADERIYMMESDSNRFGALDFQESAREYVPRGADATLEDLLAAAETVERQEDLPAPLERALGHGTTMGGARPKATISDGDHEFIAKFSRSDDPYDVVGAEAAAMTLATWSGVDAAPVDVVTVMGKKVLMVERFDRGPHGTRRFAMSALTFLELTEDDARYATYPDIVRTLRDRTPRGATPPDAEIYRRIAVNIAVSNTDDHVRNHAAFWDGESLTLTPAYDVSPMRRSGETASQAIGIGADWRERESTFATLLAHRHHYGLSEPRAREIIDQVIATVAQRWDEAAEFAQIRPAEAARMLGTQILNPGSLYGYRES